MGFSKAPLLSTVTMLALVAACDRSPQRATAPTSPVFSTRSSTSTQQDTALLRRVQ